MHCMAFAFVFSMCIHVVFRNDSTLMLANYDRPQSTVNIKNGKNKAFHNKIHLTTAKFTPQTRNTSTLMQLKLQLDSMQISRDQPPSTTCQYLPKFMNLFGIFSISLTYQISCNLHQ